MKLTIAFVATALALSSLSHAVPIPADSGAFAHDAARHLESQVRLYTRGAQGLLAGSVDDLTSMIQGLGIDRSRRTLLPDPRPLKRLKRFKRPSGEVRNLESEVEAAIDEELSTPDGPWPKPDGYRKAGDAIPWPGYRKFAPKKADMIPVSESKPTNVDLQKFVDEVEPQNLHDARTRLLELTTAHEAAVDAAGRAKLTQQPTWRTLRAQAEAARKPFAEAQEHYGALAGKGKKSA